MQSETKKNEQNNLDMEKVIRILLGLLAEQEGMKIEYTIEKIKDDVD